MSSSFAKTAHPTPSHYMVEQLRALSCELRKMAETARLDADKRALNVLALRFEKLAASLSSAEYPSAKYPPCPEVPAGANFAQAWQMACEHISKRYVLPETMYHPVVLGECYSLACTIVAYGLVSNQSSTAAPNDNKPMPEANPTVSKHRVMVVDDVADVLVSVGAFLVRAGFEVRKATNGDDALKVIAGDPSIDILVTDFAMPGLNGADLIAQATQVRPYLKALVITGYPNADGLADLPAGIKVLPKPFRQDTLVAAIRSLFETERAGHDKLPRTVSA